MVAQPTLVENIQGEEAWLPGQVNSSSVVAEIASVVVCADLCCLLCCVILPVVVADGVMVTGALVKSVQGESLCDLWGLLGAAYSGDAAVGDDALAVAVDDLEDAEDDLADAQDDLADAVADLADAVADLEDVEDDLEDVADAVAADDLDHVAFADGLGDLDLDNEADLVNLVLPCALENRVHVEVWEDVNQVGILGVAQAPWDIDP